MTIKSALPVKAVFQMNTYRPKPLHLLSIQCSVVYSIFYTVFSFVKISGPTIMTAGSEDLF